MAKHAAESEPLLPLPLVDQLSIANDLLVSPPVRQPFPERPAELVGEDQFGPAYRGWFNTESRRLDADEQRATAPHDAAAGELLDSLGISRRDINLDHEKQIAYLTIPTENQYMDTPLDAVLRLRRAASVAQFALESGYDRDAPDEQLCAVANAMIEELHALGEQAGRGQAVWSDPEYRDRRKNLELLIAASASEFGRRYGLGDSLTVSNLLTIQGHSGINLVRQTGVLQDIYSPIIDSRPAVVADKGRHHVKAPVPERRAAAPAPKVPRLTDWYYIPELAGPNTPHSGGWVPGRIGHFVLDARYTGGRLPR